MRQCVAGCTTPSLKMNRGNLLLHGLSAVIVALCRDSLLLLVIGVALLVDWRRICGHMKCPLSVPSLAM
jgi:hypothetical protein